MEYCPSSGRLVEGHSWASTTRSKVAQGSAAPRRAQGLAASTQGQNVEVGSSHEGGRRGRPHLSRVVGGVPQKARAQTQVKPVQDRIKGTELFLERQETGRRVPPRCGEGEGGPRDSRDQVTLGGGRRSPGRRPSEDSAPGGSWVRPREPTSHGSSQFRTGVGAVAGFRVGVAEGEGRVANGACREITGRRPPEEDEQVSVHSIIGLGASSEPGRQFRDREWERSLFHDGDIDRPSGECSEVQPIGNAHEPLLSEHDARVGHRASRIGEGSHPGPPECGRTQVDSFQSHGDIVDCLEFDLTRCDSEDNLPPIHCPEVRSLVRRVEHSARHLSDSAAHQNRFAVLDTPVLADDPSCSDTESAMEVDEPQVVHRQQRLRLIWNSQDRVQHQFCIGMHSGSSL